MNEHGMTTANLLRTLPEVLRNDENMLALASSISNILSARVSEIDSLRIYTRIDELPEDLLDILAYDLKVDWYDYGYPISVKRDLIKNSVKVHMMMGTKFAVETGIRSLYPNSDLEEWFEYGGDPYYFRIVLDVTNSQVTAVYSDIIKSVNMYKSLRSKIEDGENGIVFRASSTMQIQTQTGYYKFHSGMTGQRVAGTYPVRSTIGSVESNSIAMEVTGNSAPFSSTLCGTSFYKL